MKAAGKKSRRRLGRLGKTVRNLSLSALLLGLLWFNSGFSAWTAGGALDRAERRQLLPPGTVQYQEMGDRNRVLVTGEGYAYTGIVQRTRLWYSASILELISLEGEPRLLTWGFSGMIDDRGQETLPVFCLDPPEGTARAEMTLTGDYVHTVGEYQGDDQHEAGQKGDGAQGQRQPHQKGVPGAEAPQKGGQTAAALHLKLAVGPLGQPAQHGQKAAPDRQTQRVGVQPLGPPGHPLSGGLLPGGRRPHREHPGGLGRRGLGGR